MKWKFAPLLFFSVNVFAAALPSEFINDRILLTPELPDGTQLQFFTDTGGGPNIIDKALHAKYQWPTIELKADDKVVTLSQMPPFNTGKGIPQGGLNNFMKGHLFLAEKDKLNSYDGFLGGRWHAEKVISFNYPQQQISILKKLSPSTVKTFNKTPLGFQKNQQGQYTTAFPSIDIKVGERIIPTLFDTGASAQLSDSAKSILKTDAQLVGTSFISATIFDNWKKENPEWEFIEKADLSLNQDMIKVPKLTLAGKEIGPVWFTRRPDPNFHQFMSSMMDRKVEGAIGGSALKYVHVIVDYPNEVAYVK